MQKKHNISAWTWVPTLYFAEGIPYVVVMTIAVIMYKGLGLSNTDIALYTSWLYLPWVIKPFWSPFVDLLRTKRWWIISMQLLIGVSLAAVAFFIPAPFYLQATLALFWLMAFSSATHDIAADGFYMLALDKDNQALFVGIRSTFYRISMIAGQGLLVMMAGRLEQHTGSLKTAWSVTMGLLAALFAIFTIYHWFILPRPASDHASPTAQIGSIAHGFIDTFVSFFKKKNIGLSIAFMLLYRLGEALLVKMSSPFMLDSRAVGGLELNTIDVGFIYGTVGVISLTIGGIVGGIVVARQGLQRWIWPMALSITLPNVVYLLLAAYQPDSYWLINMAVAFEQFGYGFGFTAYMLYMIQIAEGEQSTAHYALCTGFMALSMMLPGMIAGWLQESLGYIGFFILVLICSVPALCIIPLLHIKPHHK